MPTVNADLLSNLEWVGLKGVGLEPNPDYAATIPHQAFMIFQGMFSMSSTLRVRVRKKATVATIMMAAQLGKPPSS